MLGEYATWGSPANGGGSAWPHVGSKGDSVRIETDFNTGELKPLLFLMIYTNATYSESSLAGMSAIASYFAVFYFFVKCL